LQLAHGTERAQWLKGRTAARSRARESFSSAAHPSRSDRNTRRRSDSCARQVRVCAGGGGLHAFEIHTPKPPLRSSELMSQRLYSPFSFFSIFCASAACASASTASPNASDAWQWTRQRTALAPKTQPHRRIACAAPTLERQVHASMRPVLRAIKGIQGG
jgi:hypothetical protein